MVHRDIKGKNILVDKTGKLKLADFGFSPPLAAQCNQELPIRPSRASPELGQEIEHKRYGAANDLWALGTVFAEMCCGNRDPTVYMMIQELDVTADATLEQNLPMMSATARDLLRIEHRHPDGHEGLLGRGRALRQAGRVQELGERRRAQARAPGRRVGGAAVGAEDPGGRTVSRGRRRVVQQREAPHAREREVLADLRGARAATTSTNVISVVVKSAPRATAAIAPPRSVENDRVAHGGR